MLLKNKITTEELAKVVDGWTRLAMTMTPAYQWEKRLDYSIPTQKYRVQKRRLGEGLEWQEACLTPNPEEAVMAYNSIQDGVSC
jgi:hypothetical protein